MKVNYLSNWISTCTNESLGSNLVTTNIDKPNLSTKDLWVDPDKWEILTRYKSIDLTSDDDSWASEGTEESSDEDDESESEEDYENASDDSNSGELE